MKATDGTGQTGHTWPRHVWVCFTGNPSDRSPGIILEWRQAKGRWSALVVYAEGGGNHEVRVVTTWADAGHIRLRE